MKENGTEKKEIVETNMMTAAFNYWFNDNGHVRSPFPKYIQVALREKAIKAFTEWAKKVPLKAKKEVNDEIIAEKFEELLFECALPLVLTEDEKLTIRYPFMMRIGDMINEKDKDGELIEGKVMDRWYYKKGDEAFMKIKLKRNLTGEIRETEFELPE